MEGEQGNNDTNQWYKNLDIKLESGEILMIEYDIEYNNINIRRGHPKMPYDY